MHRWVYQLLRLPIDGWIGTTQHLVAAHDLAHSLRQRLHMKRPAQANGHHFIVDRAFRLPLLHKPQPLLRERQRSGFLLRPARNIGRSVPFLLPLIAQPLLQQRLLCRRKVRQAFQKGAFSMRVLTSWYTRLATISGLFLLKMHFYVIGERLNIAQIILKYYEVVDLLHFFEAAELICDVHHAISIIRDEFGTQRYASLLSQVHDM